MFFENIDRLKVSELKIGKKTINNKNNDMQRKKSINKSLLLKKNLNK